MKACALSTVVEHFLHTEGVAGSNPAARTISMKQSACILAAICTSLSLSVHAGSAVTIDTNQVLVIDGKKVFPIGFTRPPPPDGKAPNGKNGIEEHRDAGATLLRTGAWGGPCNDETIAVEQRFEDAAAKYGMHCWVFLRELGAVPDGDAKREAMLR